MMQEMIAQAACAFFGTLGYALMFHVPLSLFFTCGLTGMAGWMVYSAVVTYTPLSMAVASFLGAFTLVLLARIFTVIKKCPITLFLVPGIVALVPGAGVYYTAYYLVTDQLYLAALKGMESIKVAFGIVLAIVFILSIPPEVFHRKYWKERLLFYKKREK